MHKIINSTKKFEKSLSKLNPKQKDKFYQHLSYFLENEFDFRLNTHKLKGNRSNEYSFSVTDDIRVIYQKNIIDKREVIIFILIDIGTHNKVY